MVSGSMTQDGISISGSPNPPGAILYNIAAGNTSTVSFQVKVNSLPTLNAVLNSATMKYSYLIDPNLMIQGIGATNTNIVVTTIAGTAELSINKYVDKGFADTNSTIRYTIILKNTGVITANNVYVIDTLPNGTSFILGSVQVNGVVNPSATPVLPGINIGNILPNRTATITFNALVSSTLPSPNPLINYAETTYSYQSIPGGAATFVEATSPTTTTTISHAQLVSSKSVSTDLASVGDILTFTVPISNIGSTVANGLLFIDTLPSVVSLIPGSFSQDGFALTGDPNPPGATLYNIPAGSTSMVSFQVRVNAIPTTGVILNSATMIYSYIIDPVHFITATRCTATNITLTTIIGTPNVSISKFVNKYYANLSSTIKYTIILANTGTTSANNVFVVDTLPLGATFVPGSVELNGVPNPSATLTNPGIGVGNLQINQSIIISFNALVTTIPSPNNINNVAELLYNYQPTPGTTPINAELLSNSTLTTINHAALRASKGVNTGYGSLGDILTYTIPITNSGSAMANNIVLVDTIPSGLTFIPNSMKQDGILVWGSPNPPGVTLYSIAPGATSTVIFQARITSAPDSGYVSNIASVGYNYFIDPLLGIMGYGSTVTNVAVTTIVNTSIGNIKGADKYYAQCGELITFTITLPNTGNTTALNVVLTDTIPEGTVFVPNSVTVNGVPVAGVSPAPPFGITIGTIPKGGSAVVTFKVIVVC